MRERERENDEVSVVRRRIKTNKNTKTLSFRKDLN